jgi:hypothetical protein
MRPRTLLLMAALPLAASACGGDDDAASTTSSPETTAGGTTVITTGTTQTTEPSGSNSTETTEPIPPVTPPANQPEACVVLAEAAFPGAAVDPSALTPDDRPDGRPAPSTGCRFESSRRVLTLALFYGQDPLETLAVARVENPVGSDATGIGQDAWESGGVLYVDAGSRAFAVTGGSRDELITLAQGVIANL